jgi:hypothetical protein
MISQYCFLSLSKFSGFNKLSTVPAEVLQMQRYLSKTGKAHLRLKFQLILQLLLLLQALRNLHFQQLRLRCLSPQQLLVVSIATAVESAISVDSASFFDHKKQLLPY